MKEETIYELIAAFLAGETDKEQNERLYEWVGKTPDNRRLFETMRLAWGASFADYGQMSRSKDKILGKALSKTQRRGILRPVLTAACLIGAISLGFLASLLINKEELVEPVTLVPIGEVILSTLPGQKAEATLPDGTKVWLNSGTTISYPAAYGIEERTARLAEGEIFMEVAKNEEMPFILNTSNGFIKVHGTSFNVRDYASDPSMTISLKEGSIEYFASDNKSKVMMVPGQKITLNKLFQEQGSQGNAEQENTEQADPVQKPSVAMNLQKCDAEVESLWRFGELKIEKEGFMDVMAEMERWYGVEIEVSGDIPKESYYWMTIKTESLREMLGLLSNITPLSYRIDGREVSIKVK